MTGWNGNSECSIKGKDVVEIFRKMKVEGVSSVEASGYVDDVWMRSVTPCDVEVRSRDTPCSMVFAIQLKWR